MLDIFDLTRKELDLQPDDPINIHEFIFGIKKFITSGYDIFEENAESILYKMEKEGDIISYADYYMESKKVKNKQELRHLIIKRRIRESLISHGIKFVEYKDGYKTKDGSRIFLPERIIFSNHQVISVFENTADMDDLINKMKPRGKDKLMLARKNKKNILITVDQLENFLD